MVEIPDFDASAFHSLATLLFGLFAASATTTAGKFSPFDSTSAWCGDGRAFVRLIAAVIILNVIPVAHLLFRLQSVTEVCGNTPIALAFAALPVALTPFGWYRIFVALMHIPRADMPWRRWFYTHADEYPYQFIRLTEPRRLPDSQLFVGQWYDHFISGMIWLVVCELSFGALRWNGMR